MSKLRFGIITDLHYGLPPFYGGENRILSNHAREVGGKIAKIFAEHSLDFVAQLGDLVQDNMLSPDADVDQQNYKQARLLLAECGTLLFHCIGNHDVRNIKEEQLINLIAQDRLFYKVELRNYTLIFLYFVSLSMEKIVMTSEQLLWLESELNKAHGEVIIFTHQALADQSLQSSYWYEQNPGRALVENRHEVRRILEASGKVRIVFNGHMHWNNLTAHNGINYISVGSAVENIFNDGRPNCAYALVELSEDELQVSIHGLDPVEYKVNFSKAM